MFQPSHTGVAYGDFVKRVRRLAIMGGAQPLNEAIGIIGCAFAIVRQRFPRNLGQLYNQGLCLQQILDDIGDLFAAGALGGVEDPGDLR